MRGGRGCSYWPLPPRGKVCGHYPIARAERWAGPGEVLRANYQTPDQALKLGFQDATAYIAPLWNDAGMPPEAEANGIGERGPLRSAGCNVSG